MNPTMLQYWEGCHVLRMPQLPPEILRFLIPADWKAEFFQSAGRFGDAVQVSRLRSARNTGRSVSDRLTGRRFLPEPFRGMERLGVR
jgi:hypothetical protein